MDRLLREAATRSADYLNHLETRPVFPSPEALGRLEELGGSLPDAPTDPEEVLDILDQVGSPATVTSAGGRYFGFVVGGTLPVSLAATHPSSTSRAIYVLWLSPPPKSRTFSTPVLPSSARLIPLFDTASV